MQFETTIVSIQQKTPGVKSFVLDCGSAPFIFIPGQWVDIHRTINDESHNCGYSITSIPNKNNTIEIAVKLAPDLLLTRFLHEECHPGDKLFISRAQGDIFVDGNVQGPYVFIGGGVGITPLYSMIQQVLNTKPDSTVILVYSIKTTQDFLFETEIKQIEKSFPNFHCYITVTREKQHALDFTGRISEHMLEEIHLPANARYYLCGPPPMVDAVAEILSNLKNELQLSTANVFYDKWWA